MIFKASCYVKSVLETLIRFISSEGYYTDINYNKFMVSSELDGSKLVLRDGVHTFVFSCRRKFRTVSGRLCEDRICTDEEVVAYNDNRILTDEIDGLRVFRVVEFSNIEMSALRELVLNCLEQQRVRRYCGIMDGVYDVAFKDGDTFISITFRTTMDRSDVLEHLMCSLESSLGYMKTGVKVLDYDISDEVEDELIFRLVPKRLF